MKLNSIISETINDQINNIIDRYIKDEGYYTLDLPHLNNTSGIPKSSLLKDYIIGCCKSVSKKYWKWVLNQIYKGNVILYQMQPTSGRVAEAKPYWACLEAPLPAGIPLHMDTTEYAGILLQFEKIRASLQGKERDINHYDGLSELYLTTQSFYKQSALDATEGLEIVASDGVYQVVRINTPWVLEKVGAGTGWCTRSDAPSCRSEHYIQDFGYIYVLFKGNDPYIQFTPDLSEAQYPNREFAANELITIILSIDIKDDELLLDLMESDLFWTALKASSSRKKNDILKNYENAMALNLRASMDDFYLLRIAKMHQYFGLNSEADKQRLQQYEDFTLRKQKHSRYGIGQRQYEDLTLRDENFDDTPF